MTPTAFAAYCRGFGITCATTEPSSLPQVYRYEPARTLALPHAGHPASLRSCRALCSTPIPVGRPVSQPSTPSMSQLFFSVLCFAIVLSLDLQEREYQLS